MADREAAAPDASEQVLASSSPPEPRNDEAVPHPARSWSLYTISLSFTSSLHKSLTWAKQNPIPTSRWRLSIGTVIAFAGFVIGCTALWSTLSSMNDSHKAQLLAEWTAKKDFIEFCQSLDFKPDTCASAKDMTLDPPPRIRGRAAHPGFAAIGILRFNVTGLLWASVWLILVIYCACYIWVAYKRRVPSKYCTTFGAMELVIGAEIMEYKRRTMFRENEPETALTQIGITRWLEEAQFSSAWIDAEYRPRRRR